VKVIQSTFGGKLYDLPLMPRNRQKYEVTWSGKQAEKVLELVLPFMIIKRAQALLVLDAMRNQRTSRTSLRAGLSLEQRTKNNAANLQIRELNRVGKPN